MLSENIAKNLSFKLCSHSVKLYEIRRKSSARTFAFHCENKQCSGQTDFLSCPQIPVVTVLSDLWTDSLHLRCSALMGTEQI